MKHNDILNNVNTCSVLVSVYEKEKADYFNQMLDSVWYKQELKPDQIVLVKDGLLTPKLDNAVSEWKNKIGDKLDIIQLSENKGLAAALNEGLKHCEGTIIIRMDTDDIMHPYRIKKQMEFLKDHPDIDIVGAYISEIDENNRGIKGVVKYPITHNECYRFFKYRDCFAHPATAIRKSFFDDVGEYSEIHVGENKNEDSNLWYRGFLKGKHYANIPEILLYYRRTSDFYKRRGGYKRALMMLKERLKMNRELKYGVGGAFAAFTVAFFQLIPFVLKKYLYQLR